MLRVAVQEVLSGRAKLGCAASDDREVRSGRVKLGCVVHRENKSDWVKLGSFARDVRSSGAKCQVIPDLVERHVR